MNLLLATIIYAYAGLTAAQWVEASQWLRRPPGQLWCGNVVSDPYMLLVNVLTPLSATANLMLVCRGLKMRRWSPRTITATITFLIASGFLAYEGYLLRSWYGVPLGDVWWLPWV